MPIHLEPEILSEMIGQGNGVFGNLPVGIGQVVALVIGYEHNIGPMDGI
jgi:hypothetical protein